MNSVVVWYRGYRRCTLTWVAIYLSFSSLIKHHGWGQSPKSVQARAVVVTQSQLASVYGASLLAGIGGGLLFHIESQ